jgi:hypothetical protein
MPVGSFLGHAITGRIGCEALDRHPAATEPNSKVTATQAGKVREIPLQITVEKGNRAAISISKSRQG